MVNGYTMDKRILDIDGWMAEIELEWLNYTAARVPINGLIVEIGAWKGRSSSAIYTGGSLTKTIVSIDTWMGSPDESPHDIAKTQDIFHIYMQNMSILGIEPRDYLSSPFYENRPGVFFIKGDSVESSKHFEDKSIDWLFIDGWHSQLSKDLDAYMPKMKPNGLLTGHDYFCFYNEIQQEIHKRFYIHQIVHSIWIKSMDNYKTPEWYSRGN